jgi:hypothetical protein
MEGREGKNRLYFNLIRAAKQKSIPYDDRRKWKWWQQHRDDGVLDFIAQHFDLMTSWQADLSVPLIVVA